MVVEGGLPDPHSPFPSSLKLLESNSDKHPALGNEITQVNGDFAFGSGRDGGWNEEEGHANLWDIRRRLHCF